MADCRAPSASSMCLLKEKRRGGQRERARDPVSRQDINATPSTCPEDAENELTADDVNLKMAGAETVLKRQVELAAARLARLYRFGPSSDRVGEAQTGDHIDNQGREQVKDWSGR